MAGPWDSKLKAFTLEAIEEAIAKALSELAGGHCTCDVREMTFDGLGKVSMRLGVHAPMVKPDNVVEAGRKS